MHWIVDSKLWTFKVPLYFPFTKVKILSTHNLRRLLLRWQMVKTLGVVLSNVKCNFMQGSNIHCEHARPCQCVCRGISVETLLFQRRKKWMYKLQWVLWIVDNFRPFSQARKWSWAVVTKSVSVRVKVCARVHPRAARCIHCHVTCQLGPRADTCGRGLAWPDVVWLGHILQQTCKGWFNNYVIHF